MGNIDLTILCLKIFLLLFSIGMILEGLISFKVIYDHYYYGKDYLARITKMNSRRHRSGLIWTYHYIYSNEDGFEYEGKFKKYHSPLKNQSSECTQGDLVNISYLPHKPTKSIYIRYNQDMISATIYLITGILMLIKIYFVFAKWDAALNSIK